MISRLACARGIELHEGVPLKESEILNTLATSEEVLDSLYSAHQGINSVLATARQRLFGPCLDASTRQTGDQCQISNSITRQAILKPALNPEFPFH